MSVRRLSATLTALAATCCVAVAVPVALASPPSGHGKGSTHATHPKPSKAHHGKLKTKAQLTGQVLSVDAADFDFVMSVKGGHLAYHKHQVKVYVTTSTVIRYHGHAIDLSRVPEGAKVTTKVALFGDGTVFAIWVNVGGKTVLLPAPSASASPSATETTSPADDASASASESASASASATS